MPSLAERGIIKAVVLAAAFALEGVGIPCLALGEAIFSIREEAWVAASACETAALAAIEGFSQIYEASARASSP